MTEDLSQEVYPCWGSNKPSQGHLDSVLSPDHFCRDAGSLSNSVTQSWTSVVASVCKGSIPFWMPGQCQGVSRLGNSLLTILTTVFMPKKVMKKAPTRWILIRLSRISKIHTFIIFYYVISLSIPCCNHTGLPNSFCLCFVITCGLLLTIPVGLVLSWHMCIGQRTSLESLSLTFCLVLEAESLFLRVFVYFFTLYTPS